ncbi:putative RNA-directed DNA polymerase [Helianthus annuus]|nr:putative RNA-directed DNA polymerase [Helianthus annuus]
MALLPKSLNSVSLNDYRPISLIGCMPKVTGKILACIIQRVINGLIGFEQTTYIKGRNIFDGHILLNVIHTWARKSHKQLLLFKVDFAKAFDSVNWNYLGSILLKMGFSD